MDAMTFLDHPKPPDRRAVYAVYGDEDFLRKLARERIIEIALGDADPSFAVAAYQGDKLDFSTVRNELDTLPFLSPCRVVVVENADPFVTQNRPALERYVSQPPSAGVLVLDLKTFPETTKLAKALPDAAKIVCKTPYEDKLPGWCTAWAKKGGKQLSREAATLLVELVGPTMGLLAQEVDKLCVAAGAARAITPEDVERLASRSRSADVFRILDAIADGRPAAALGTLEDLFADGEDPLAILGPLTAQLRKLATVGRQLALGEPLPAAMDAAKVPKWEKARQGCEKQLRWLGRRRLDRLSEWLVEINHGVKGGSALPERIQVERLIVRLAQPRPH